MGNPMDLDNPVFKSYLFYCCVLIIKMLIMVPLTARQRMAKKVCSNPEDVPLMPKGEIKFDDPDVERVRRAHRNDLENIPIFFVAAFAYLMTNPAPWLAVNLFRLVTLGRILHTVVYAVVVVPQPARAIAFFMGLFPTAYMAVTAMIHFL